MGTLKQEIEMTVLWFAELDMENFGYVTDSTREAAGMQNVSLENYENDN
ncbi:MAG: hypothetical protein WKF87_06610 [Chryseolinea sp.]